MDSSKRRRLDSPRNTQQHAPTHSPIESSSDELAAGSDHDEERRRTSWSIQKAYPPKRPYPRSRSFSGSESPDELAVDAEVYWRSRNRGRGRRSPSSHESEMMSEERYDDEEEEEEEEDAEGEEQEDGDAEDEGEEEGKYSDRSPTPVPPPPPPPPPKPGKLNYREKYLLLGHLRGVSAVRFSPGASMIASGGMLHVRFACGGC